MSLDRLGWEYSGLSAPRFFSDVKIGDYSKFMSAHFMEYFGVPAKAFAPYRFSLLFGHDEYKTLSSERIEEIIDSNRIPTDKDIILAMGRADHIKGFDILLNSITLLNSDVHLVLIAVPYMQDDPIIDYYKALIDDGNISCTLITHFTRELPRALCQFDNCRIVACPSRGEPFPMVTLEVSLWANLRGPVLLCADLEGFCEQIEDGVNGYLYHPNKPSELAAKISKVLSYDADTLNNVRRKAYQRVINERDFVNNFTETLDYFWGEMQESQKVIKRRRTELAADA